MYTVHQRHACYATFSNLKHLCQSATWTFVDVRLSILKWGE